MSDELTGVWTYRSFRNRTAEADSLDQLLAGQGELVIEHPAAPGALSGRLVFRGEAPTAKDPRLTLVGGLSGGHARFQGIGVKGTQADGWVYDYEARLVPSWPNGVHQRPALVGSVIRTVPHAAGAGQTAPAGTVFSFVACKRDFLEPRLVIPLPDATRAMLAGAGHRLWHLIWHTVSWRLAARIAHGAEARHPPARLGAGRAEQRRRCARRRRRLWADPHQRVRRRLSVHAPPDDQDGRR